MAHTVTRVMGALWFHMTHLSYIFQYKSVNNVLMVKFRLRWPCLQRLPNYAVYIIVRKCIKCTLYSLILLFGEVSNPTRPEINLAQYRRPDHQLPDSGILSRSGIEPGTSRTEQKQTTSIKVLAIFYADVIWPHKSHAQIDGTDI